MKKPFSKIKYFIWFIFLRFSSYYLLTPLIILIWINLILLVCLILFFSNISYHEIIYSLRDFWINSFLNNIFNLDKIENYHCSWDKCTKDLSNLVWNILFFFSLIFWFLNFLFSKIFKINIKINLFKIIKYFSFFSFILIFWYLFILMKHDVWVWMIILFNIFSIVCHFVVYFMSLFWITILEWSNWFYDKNILDIVEKSQNPSKFRI